jgi:hypothetical protein
VLVSGADFPDALSASVPAAVRGWPILLTAPAALPAETARTLAELGIQHLVVVGGEAAVPASVVAEVRAAVPGLAAEGAVERHAGPTRYDTGAAVALAYPGADPAAVALASGTAFADALAGAPLAAQRGETLLLTGEALPEPTARRLLAAAPSGLTLLGGPAAVAEEAVRAAHAVLADRALPVTTEPAAGTELAALDVGTSVRIAADLAVDAEASQAQLEVDGREVALNLRAEGRVLVAEVRALPADLAGAPAAEQRHDVRLVAAVRQAGPGVDPVRHAEVHFSLVRRPRPPLIRTAEGFDLVGGDGPVAGFGGPVRTYSLEVEPGTGVDPLAFAQEAEAALSDPRGWTARGERRLQRVGSADAGIRVVLATPATVDRFCARAGLRTAGVYSCWNGRFAMINLDRWNGGSAAFAAPLAEYRGYVLNHETGHGLGYHHVGCPAAGALAPVMMQQTISTGACRPNPWPYP